MSDALKRRVQGLQAQGGAVVVAGGQRGIEKESLRISPQGFISERAHPAALGSALTNKYVTTDYSEALLEFVTPPVNSAWSAMQFMCDLHQFTYDLLDDELLWPFSMPCRLRSEDDIPLARYGTSNVGRMKTIYRNGLGLRYGRYMQVISGIHFNYSVPDSFWAAWREVEGRSDDLAALKSDTYMGVVRNVRRLDWLLLYLFGASPAICPSFLEGKETNLKALDDSTFYGEYATSLRMSDLGYQNSNQARLHVSANSLDDYVRDLSAAIETPNAEYAALGVRDGGEYLQLNTNLLQIENEFYSTIRPKRVARSGERPTAALRRGGVEYVELRALDISPFDPAGIGQTQEKFLEAFLLYCLLLDSPDVSAAERSDLKHNHSLIAHRGREPGLRLRLDGGEIAMQDRARSICEQMLPVCELLDGGDEGGYCAALEQQLLAIEDPAQTPSARLLRELQETGQSFAEYGLSLARDYGDYFRSLDTQLNAHAATFAAESAASVQRQAEIEAADTLSLDEYLARYYA